MNTDKKRKKIGRRRRVAGWTLLTLGLLVAGVWTVSGWWWFGYGYGSKGQSICFLRGRIDVNGLFTTGEKWAWFIYTAPEMKPRFVWWGQMPSYDQSQGFENWNAGIACGATLRRKGVVIQSLVQVFWWPLPLSVLLSGTLLLSSGSRARRRGASRPCPVDAGKETADASRD